MMAATHPPNIPTPMLDQGKKGVKHHGSNDFGQDEITGRINPHHFQCIDLFCDAHMPDFRRQCLSLLFRPGSSPTMVDENSQQDCITGGKTDQVKRYPGAFQVIAGLEGDDSSDEDRNQYNNTN
ncbi:MAG: hypothetical protein MZV63_13115 [Marinilabiliales bacterium]|nr:hypothetical protein [Marinilabiliales bacterium]